MLTGIPAVLALIGIAIALVAPAQAHVTAEPGTAQQGGYTVINFRVPNESDTAGTVKVVVTFPADNVISGARTTPQVGWDAKVVMTNLDDPLQVGERTITERVATVTWTAQKGTRIGPNQFVDFPLSVGPLPTDTDVLHFPTAQSYDDGSVVEWKDIAEGDQEPDHPAPTVELTAATDGGHHDATATEPSDHDEVARASGGGTDDVARWLGLGGLLVGAIGIGMVVGSRRGNQPLPIGDSKIASSV